MILPTITDPFIFPRTGIKARNRTVLAAMTNKQSHNDGTLSDSEILWLKMRSSGGFGIITTAATNISRDGKGWQGELGVYDNIHIPGLERLANEIHADGSLILAQLFHGGARSPQELTGQIPLSATRIPSDVSETGYTRPADRKDITRIIKDFGASANRCVQAGFDGIELHGAHGYLISQFLGSTSNQRTDEWGGNFSNRVKFLREILYSVKATVPSNFLVGIRLSPEISGLGIDINETLELVNLLNEDGIDFIHLSVWDFEARSRKYKEDPRRLTEWFTSEIKDLPPLISTGAVWSRKDADSLFSQGTDLAGIGRAAIAYPDWAKNATDKNYKPERPPFTPEHLAESGLSDTFIEYMKNWKGFVARSRS